ncbi:DUF3054 domain-containing protein [Microbacterium dextranolyticum]|uniref:DUF3054 domain-containing protein n=1 Tax=Microbacterium dextranolyticum TaxID=36806 RepID=A0A9W6HK31_9MICO|nr:DUF3054 domain-containing protein [Microbacterium dextranolyticum]MBM7461879.1 hypothetical protein [Microbacterium dextranolyticum]GLJ94120.1 hypothetical protein GCM10017591_01810 [Microbacterium dextranolyticum]
MTVPSSRTRPASIGPAAPPRAVVVSAAFDVVLVVVFAAIGRASHGEDVWGGLAVTAWPFVVALVLGWLVVRAWRAPDAPVRTGLAVWAVTVAGGMVLRAVSGQGVQVAFIIVAAVVLLLFLVGRRALTRLIARVGRR